MIDGGFLVLLAGWIGLGIALIVASRLYCRLDGGHDWSEAFEGTVFDHCQECGASRVLRLLVFFFILTALAIYGWAVSVREEVTGA